VVGFNRRYAPLVLEIQKRMSKMVGPFVLNYRVNAGFVPANRWSQDPSVGGGRIIHECCHFFDLFNFLLGGGGEPKISVETAGVTGSETVARDNLSVALRYPDGSLAHLLYVAVGSKSQERERFEVYGQKSSMVLDDFKELTVYDGGRKTTSLPRSDKGHANELEQLARLARGLPTSIISTQEVYSATELTFRVDEASRATLQG
jgi:predicted dehydrogenase